MAPQPPRSGGASYAPRPRTAGDASSACTAARCDAAAAAVDEPNLREAGGTGGRAGTPRPATGRREGRRRGGRGCPRAGSCDGRVSVVHGRSGGGLRRASSQNPKAPSRSRTARTQLLAGRRGHGREQETHRDRHERHAGHRPRHHRGDRDAAAEVPPQQAGHAPAEEDQRREGEQPPARASPYRRGGGRASGSRPMGGERWSAVRVSVVVPVYNEERTITELLDRVAGAPFPNEVSEVEIVVVDDCSRDGTAARLAAYRAPPAAAAAVPLQLAPPRGQPRQGRRPADRLRRRRPAT